MFQFRRITLAVALAVSANVATAAAVATPDLQLSAGSESWTASQLGVSFTPDSSNPDISNAIGSKTIAGTLALNWDIDLKADPFILTSIGLTNLTGSAQNYSLVATLPTSTFGLTTKQGGSIAIKVIDTSLDSFANVTTSSTPGIYQAKIDGTSQFGLYGGNVNCFGGPNCNQTASDLNGLSAVNVLSAASFGFAGPAVGANLQLLLNFNLSAGDRVEIQALYEVVPVPLPATLPLLASAMVGVFTARRRAQKGA